MAETRSQSRANEQNNESLNPIEDGEVPDLPNPNQPQSLEGITLDQLNTSASILGFSWSNSLRWLNFWPPLVTDRQQRRRGLGPPRWGRSSSRQQKSEGDGRWATDGGHNGQLSTPIAYPMFSANVECTPGCPLIAKKAIWH
jgi:hypothetical protein